MERVDGGGPGGPGGPGAVEEPDRSDAAGDNPEDNPGGSPGGGPSGALTVGVEVEGGPAWIRVRADSETVFEEVAPAGFSRTFEASRGVGIRVGDAGAVHVEVNGQDLGPLGDPGQVLERDYTLKSAS